MAGVRHRIACFFFFLLSSPSLLPQLLILLFLCAPSRLSLVTAIYLSLASPYNYSKGFNTSAGLLPSSPHPHPFESRVDLTRERSTPSIRVHRLDSLMFVPPRKII